MFSLSIKLYRTDDKIKRLENFGSYCTAEPAFIKVLNLKIQLKKSAPLKSCLTVRGWKFRNISIQLPRGLQ